MSREPAALERWGRKCPLTVDSAPAHRPQVRRRVTHTHTWPRSRNPKAAGRIDLYPSVVLFTRGRAL
eukprot:4809152-Prymnesium_polylepis.1